MNKIRDKEMIEHVERWPIFPLLPVKRGTTFESLQLGFICNNHLTSVVEGNIFMLPLSDISKLKIHNYNSIEALLDDGWIVD